jgi:chemotaxis response regulator CheB
LVVLHMSEPFGLAMAEWLDAQTPLPVRYAKNDEILPTPGGGCVLMVPPDYHLALEEGRLELLVTPERHSCRP